VFGYVARRNSTGYWLGLRPEWEGIVKVQVSSLRDWTGECARPYMSISRTRLYLNYGLAGYALFAIDFAGKFGDEV
jgi:hypothetical protein